MVRRTLWFILIALIGAAICVRLGMWQLSRHTERREANARVSSRIDEAPAPFAVVAPLGDSARFRRVTLSGVADYSRELVHASRTNGGSPGVHLLTPVRVAESDTVVLLNRGWVYSPDGTVVDHERWREGDTLQVSGFAERFLPGRQGAEAGRTDRVLRVVDREEVARRIGMPVAPIYVIATTIDSRPARATDTPVRLAPPELGRGAHLGYALQWFAFAAIAVIGVAVIARRR